VPVARAVWAAETDAKSAQLFGSPPAANLRNDSIINASGAPPFDRLLACGSCRARAVIAQGGSDYLDLIGAGWREPLASVELARPIVPLIICGGAGTRLWPASRENRPQGSNFLPLFGRHSTFQETHSPGIRSGPLSARRSIVTNGQYRFLSPSNSRDRALKPTSCSNQPGAIRDPRSLPAPPMRSGAAAIPSSLRLPPITFVTDPGAFAKVCDLAGDAAQDDQIVMFGVHPDPAGDRIRLHSPRDRPFGPRCSPSNGSWKSRDAETAAALCGRRIFVETLATSSSAPGFLLEEYRRYEPDSARRLRQRSMHPAPISASSRSMPRLSGLQRRNRSTTR